MTKNTELANYQPNSCKPVYKYTSKGKLATTYNSMTEAIKGEHVAYGKLKDLISSGDLLRNHFFSLVPKEPASRPVNGEVESRERELWETETGMFNIAGWAKICF
jgi:hypothetical protein